MHIPLPCSIGGRFGVLLSWHSKRSGRYRARKARWSSATARSRAKNLRLALGQKIRFIAGLFILAMRPIPNRPPRGSAEWNNRTSQVIRRINCKLGPKGEILQMAKSIGAALSLGRYYTIDVIKNRIARTHLDLERIRREEDVQ